MKVLRQHQLYAKFSKCEFWLRSVTFLGVVSEKGMEVDPRKTEVVKKWSKPLNPIDICSILGLDGYYCRFVEGFSSIATPLTTLTKKKSSLNGRRLARRVSRISTTDSLQPRCLLCLSVVRITLCVVMHLGLVRVVFLCRVVR